MNNEANKLNALVEQAKGYDASALAGICRLFYDKIYRFVFYKVSSKEDAEDITGEVFMKMVEKLNTQSGSFKAWLYKIASNSVIDYYRSRGTKNEVKLTENLQDEQCSFDKLDNLMSLEKIKNALVMLTEEQQEFITHKFFNGLDNEEI